MSDKGFMQSKYDVSDVEQKRMPKTKKEKNPEYIEGAAGKNDTFKFRAVELQEYFSEQSKDKKATKKSIKTVTPNFVQREVLSTELEQGMTIKAEDGGKQQARSGESR